MTLSYSIKNFFAQNFPALMQPDYRRFWTGQCVSLIGTWMQNIALSWLVYSITNSPLLTGLAGAVQFLPVMFFSLFAGTYIDRYPKRNILIGTQITAMVLAFILSGLVFTNTIQYWHILLLGLMMGLTNTVDMPTRQAYTIEIAGRENLMNAISLNSMVFNLARILGPAVGGLILGYAGAGWCFFINGISYIAVIFQLMRITSAPQIRPKNPDKKVLQEVWDGLLHIKKDVVLLQTILMILVIGIFVFNFNVLIPVFTKNILHMDGKIYGLLMSCLGAGSLIGALITSFRSKTGPKMSAMVVSAILISVFLMLTGITRIFWLTALMLGLTGVFNIFFTTMTNTTLQLNSGDEYRSRVMSVYSFVFAGATPLGNLFAGYVSDRFGAAMAFVLCGGCTFVFVVGTLILIKKRKNP
jgi:predicted MFS family arabinose efflux permease